MLLCFTDSRLKANQNFNKIPFLWLNYPEPAIYLLKMKVIIFRMLLEIRKQNYEFNSEF